LSGALRPAGVLAWATAALALTACDLGPLGASALDGERVSAAISDWSWLEPRYSLDVQTHASALLPSAHAWFVVQDGTLWLYAMSSDLEPPWLARLRDEDPGVTIGVDGKIHEARAVLVTDPAELEPLLPRVLAKYHLVETSRARFAPPSARFPATRIHHWFFRVEPPAAASR
jgi:hypothetical protein